MVQVIHYVVRPGDTMWLIARRFGVGLTELITANPEIEDPDMILPGQVLHIPRRQRVNFPGVPGFRREPWLPPMPDHDDDFWW